MFFAHLILNSSISQKPPSCTEVAHTLYLKSLDTSCSRRVTCRRRIPCTRRITLFDYFFFLSANTLFPPIFTPMCRFELSSCFCLLSFWLLSERLGRTLSLLLLCTGFCVSCSLCTGRAVHDHRRHVTTNDEYRRKCGS